MWSERERERGGTEMGWVSGCGCCRILFEREGGKDKQCQNPLLPCCTAHNIKSYFPSTQVRSVHVTMLSVLARLTMKVIEKRNKTPSVLLPLFNDALYTETQRNVSEKLFVSLDYLANNSRLLGPGKRLILFPVYGVQLIGKAR